MLIDIKPAKGNVLKLSDLQRIRSLFPSDVIINDSDILNAYKEGFRVAKKISRSSRQKIFPFTRFDTDSRCFFTVYSQFKQ